MKIVNINIYILTKSLNIDIIGTVTKIEIL